MKLVGAALVLLAISGCSAEVVEEFFASCDEFFADPYGIASPPTRFYEPQYKQICQTVNDSVQYATYYDTDNKIPMYSAYRFLGVNNCENKSRSSWFIEPQLDQQNGDRNMAPQGNVSRTIRGNNQALNEDYTGSGYHTGHLAPVSHTNTQICSDATFTLTNAAPQDPSFNSGQWRVTEKKVSDILSTKCLNKSLSAYVVTGVVPGNKKIKNRVNVPSYFWTAYCCLDNDKKPQISGGFYGANVNEPVNNVSVSELEILLKDKYKKGSFQLFGKVGCVKLQGPEALNLERCRNRSRIVEEYARDLVSGTIKPRSIYERNCARRYASASSRQRKLIVKHCAVNLLSISIFKPISKIDDFCGTVFGFASSRPRSSDEEYPAILRTEKDNDDDLDLPVQTKYV
ncbi:endonuclease domain-containing 1 protein-like [Trichomycterus rosablanca]|uniref:endonuclease domain-containing 1 protein-like n=1 Tax=Trichomycterus rosablanca TaxID=2290929 RepID=UPI002F359F8E